MKTYKLILLCTALTLCSCAKEWEYKTISIDGVNSSTYRPNQFELSESTLNSLGKEGWELAESFTVEETVHPNFGDEKYVTGIRSNTRTKTVTLIFKRLK